MERNTRTGRLLRRLAPSAILVVASFAFRFPALLNAESTNSDAAVVGLQAMHILRGEWSWFLWGSGYQSSVDSAVAAVFFALLGPSPLALMLSSLSLHVLLTWLVFATLRRRTTPWAALVLTLPLVFTPSSVHSYALYPPRQAALTLAMASFCILDFAPSAKRPTLAFASGAAVAAIACFADPYPLLLMPIVFLFAALVAVDRQESETSPPRLEERLRAAARRLGPCALGALAGAFPSWLLRHSAGAKNGPMTLTTHVIEHNWRLLVDECLPWAMSTKVYYAKHVMDYAPWEPPRLFHAVELLGALTLAVLVTAAFLLVRNESIPWPVRRLGLAGALTFPLAIGAFLVSVMVMDHFSMRYLAVLTLMTPFALAPAATWLSRERFAIAIAPFVVSSAVAGWVGYGPFVRGPLPVVAHELGDDYALGKLLDERGIRYAMADYWTSYRLTLLFRERVIVVPKNAAEDRFPPYRSAFEEQPRFAYVFDPGRSREQLAGVESDLAKSGARVEPVRVGALTVFVVERKKR